MTDQQHLDPFERKVAREIRTYSGLGLRSFDADAISAAARGAHATPGAWLPRLSWFPWVSPGVLGLGMLVGLLAFAAGLVVVGALLQRPRVTPGLLAVAGGDRILIVDPATGDIRPITVPDAHDAYPVWSPDGERIAFVQGDGRGPVQVIDGDGGNVQVIGDGLGSGEVPAWSPDGDSIAFAGYRYPGVETHGLYVGAVDGGTPRLVVPDVGARRLAWSPDGSRIAFVAFDDASGGEQVYVVDVRAGTLTRVSDLALRTEVYVPLSWAPDGSALTYDRAADSNAGGIVVAELASGSWREQLVIPDERSAAVTEPIVLPNGRLLFLRGDQAWTASADGTDRRRVSDIRLDASDAPGFAPGCVAPDGSALVLPMGLSPEGPGSDLVIVDLQAERPPLRIAVEAPGHGYGPICSWQARQR